MSARARAHAGLLSASDGVRESVLWLTVMRVRPPEGHQAGAGVLPWAPLVGVGLGTVAGGLTWGTAEVASPFVGAVVGIAVLALLTRGLHLDGLADTADGLGPLRDRARALEVMRAGDVGPFGVATLVLTVLLQVACLTQLLGTEDGWLALPTAVLAGRLALARGGLTGVPIAAGSALAAAVAGTVSRRWLAAWLLAAVLLTAGSTQPDAALALRLGGAGVAGLLAGELLHRHARRRLGGVNGDVLGAACEVTTTGVLLAAAVLLG